MEKDWELAILMDSKEYFDSTCGIITHDMISYAAKHNMYEMASYIREKLYPSDLKSSYYSDSKIERWRPKRRTRYFDSYSDGSLSDAEDVTDLSALYDNEITYKPNKLNKQIINIAKHCVNNNKEETFDPIDELKEKLSKGELECDLKLLNDGIKCGAYWCLKYIIKRYKFDLDEAYLYAKNVYNTTTNEAIKTNLVKIISLLDRNDYNNCDATITLDFSAEQLASEVSLDMNGNKVDKLSLCFAVQCDNFECYYWLEKLFVDTSNHTKYVYEIAKINNSEKILEYLKLRQS